MKLTPEQRQALKRVYDRHQPPVSYLSFRRGVQQLTFDRCIMVRVAGMWLGIEADGYTHS